MKHAALSRPEVATYMQFLVENAQEVVPATGYHALSAEEYSEGLAQLRAVIGATD